MTYVRMYMAIIHHVRQPTRSPHHTRPDQTRHLSQNEGSTVHTSDDTHRDYNRSVVESHPPPLSTLTLTLGEGGVAGVLGLDVRVALLEEVLLHHRGERDTSAGILRLEWTQSMNRPAETPRTTDSDQTHTHKAVTRAFQSGLLPITPPSRHTNSIKCGNRPATPTTTTAKQPGDPGSHSASRNFSQVWFDSTHLPMYT